MRKPQNFQWKEMTMGTCYYPEHWSRELWQDDLQRMKAAGITVIRVAEFAWNKVEPEEGVFTFDFWDEFMELCKQEEMQVIFGTPTATPPAWLTEKIPGSFKLPSRWSSISSWSQKTLQLQFTKI